MDALDAAARHLAAFEPLAALRLVALSDDPRALMLRGVAMAQLGESATARQLLARATRRLPPLLRARCIAARGEIALATRDLRAAGAELEAAAGGLEREGDALNARFVRLQMVRRDLVLGEVARARERLAAIDLREAPPTQRAIAARIEAEIALRDLRARDARGALARARRWARATGIAALVDEVDRVRADLDAPAARHVVRGVERFVVLDDVERLFETNDLVVDACRRRVLAGDRAIDLRRRPVLLALAVAMGSGSTARSELAAAAFGTRKLTDSARVRLRVEIGRLRRILAGLAGIQATPEGFALDTARRVSVLLPPSPGPASATLALLAGGDAWSTSAIAAAVGASQRAVQRTLAALREEGRVTVVGRGRQRRWVTPPAEATFATTLLLLGRREGR